MRDRARPARPGETGPGVEHFVEHIVEHFVEQLDQEGVSIPWPRKGVGEGQASAQAGRKVDLCRPKISEYILLTTALLWCIMQSR